MIANVNCLFVENRKTNLTSTGTISIPNRGPFKPPSGPPRSIAEVITVKRLPFIIQLENIATAEEVEAGIIEYNNLYSAGNGIVRDITATDSAQVDGNPADNFTGTVTVTWSRATDINALILVKNLDNVPLPVTSDGIQARIAALNSGYSVDWGNIYAIDTYSAIVEGILPRGTYGSVTVAFNYIKLWDVFNPTTNIGLIPQDPNNPGFPLNGFVQVALKEAFPSYIQDASDINYDLTTSTILWMTGIETKGYTGNASVEYTLDADLNKST